MHVGSWDKLSFFFGLMKLKKIKNKKDTGQGWASVGTSNPAIIVTIMLKCSRQISSQLCDIICSKPYARARSRILQFFLLFLISHTGTPLPPPIPHTHPAMHAQGVWVSACYIMTALSGQLVTTFRCNGQLIKIITALVSLWHIISCNRCMSQGLNQQPIVTNTHFVSN